MSNAHVCFDSIMQNDQFLISDENYLTWFWHTDGWKKICQIIMGAAAARWHFAVINLFINFVLASHFVTAIWLIKIKFKNTFRNWLEADSSTSMNCTCQDNKFISRVFFSLWQFYGFHLLSHRVYKRFFCSKYINWTLERSSSCLSTLWYGSIVAYKKIVPH